MQPCVAAQDTATLSHRSGYSGASPTASGRAAHAEVWAPCPGRELTHPRHACSRAPLLGRQSPSPPAKGRAARMPRSATNRRTKSRAAQRTAPSIRLHNEKAAVKRLRSTAPARYLGLLRALPSPNPREKAWSARTVFRLLPNVELTGPTRQGGLARSAKMYRAPPTGPSRPAAAGPVERRVRRLGGFKVEVQHRLEGGA